MVRSTLNVILKRQTDIVEIAGKVDGLLEAAQSDAVSPR